MLCEKCQNAKATVHVTEVVAGSAQMKKLNLCEGCWNDTEICKKLRENPSGWTSHGPTKTFLSDEKKDPEP